MFNGVNYDAVTAANDEDGKSCECSFDMTGTPIM
jgi:hypothetical protein